MKSLTILACALALATLPTFPLAAQTVSTLTTNLGVDGDGIIVAPTGEVYVAGGGPTDVVLRIAHDGTVNTFADSIPSPVGIALDDAGEFFVNNYRENTVSRISPDGGVSILATGLNGPAGVVVNGRDEILVSEFGANFTGTCAAVRKLSRDGSIEPFITGDGLRDPVGIAVDEEDNVYVANWNTGEIFRSDGETIALLAEIAGRVNQIAYAGGYLYVPSPSLRQIFRIDREGSVEHVAGNGASGSADGPALEATFMRPNGIAVGPDGRTLYIVDAGAQSVRVLQPAPSTAAETDFHPAQFTLHPCYPNPTRGQTRIRFTFDRPSQARLVVYDMLGREVALLSDGPLGAGSHEKVLDASHMPSGTYLYRLEAEGHAERRVLVVVR